MERNRKILLSILALIALSAVLAIVEISLTMQYSARESLHMPSPKVGPGIGIVRLSGPIEFGDPSDSPFAKGLGAESVLQRLNELKKDSNIRAIVVRINSPGGTVAATQEIFQKIMEIKKSKNIPVLATMGDLAASGGYYIASACGPVFANHGTLTGSIGVIMAAPNLSGLFDKLGIKMNVIKSGKYKDILSSYRDITPEDRELLQDLIDSTYNKFLKDVSLGRNMPISDIKPYADGRIMTGEIALKNKLIDQLGTFEDAIAKARALAKLPDDAPVYDELKTPIEKLLLSLEGFFNKTIAVETGIPRRKTQLIEYRYIP